MLSMPTLRPAASNQPQFGAVHVFIAAPEKRDESWGDNTSPDQLDLGTVNPPGFFEQWIEQSIPKEEPKVVTIEPDTSKIHLGDEVSYYRGGLSSDPFSSEARYIPQVLEFNSAVVLTRDDMGRNDLSTMAGIFNQGDLTPKAIDTGWEFATNLKEDEPLPEIKTTLNGTEYVLHYWA